MGFCFNLFLFLLRYVIAGRLYWLTKMLRYIYYYIILSSIDNLKRRVQQKDIIDVIINLQMKFCIILRYCILNFSKLISYIFVRLSRN